MKKQLLILLILLLTYGLSAQEKLSLEKCLENSRGYYPLIKQKEIIAKTDELNNSSIWKGYFPQMTVSAQATYQSDVTNIPIKLPGMKIDPLSNDQYKAVADISQTIYDGGIISTSSDIAKLSSAVELQKNEVDLYKIKEQVVRIYFNILLLDEQRTQADITKSDLTASREKINSAYLNGTSTRTNIDVLDAEIFKIEQRICEIKFSRKANAEVLSLITGIPCGESVELSIPNSSIIDSKSVISRPEINLFLSQKNLFSTQEEMISAKQLPKLGLFFTGGYGKPALNALKNDFDWYYVTGVKLSWSPSVFYTSSNEHQIAELNRKSVDVQNETFQLLIKQSVAQINSDIEKLKELLSTDEKIVKLRTSVKESSKAQLENGTITSYDFVRDVNAESSAKQNLSTHKLQLLQAEQNMKLALGL